MDNMDPSQRSPVAEVREGPSVSPNLYGIADADTLGLEALPAATATMAEAGVRWIQVRIKQGSDRQRFDAAEACCRAVEGAECDLWLDDRADLAALLPFAGVHVGQKDLPPAAVRRVVGDRLRIGSSCHDDEQIRQANADPAIDVVALGPIYATQSKQDPDPVVGLEGLKRARAATSKTLVAIGGIDGSRLPEVLATGADAAVVLGALCHGDVARNSRQLVAIAEACT